MNDRAPKRKPSASPVCYADEVGIAPGYMWAEDPSKPKHAPHADSVGVRASRVKSKLKPKPRSKKSAAR